MLRPDGQPDRVRADARRFQLLCRELGVSGRRRVNDEALDIRHIRQKREESKPVDEAKCLFFSAPDVKGKDRPAAVREIPLVQPVIGVIGQRRVVHPLNLRMGREVFDDLLCVFRMTLQAQGKRLRALQ